MEKKFDKEFESCPACGSKDRFFESMGKEVVERGLARPNWRYCLDSKEGVAVDPTREATIPIGSEMPSWGYQSDVCLDCGNIYVIRLNRDGAKKSIQQAGPQVPGMPRINNPLLS